MLAPYSSEEGPIDNSQDYAAPLLRVQHVLQRKSVSFVNSDIMCSIQFFGWEYMYFWSYSVKNVGTP